MVVSSRIERKNTQSSALNLSIAFFALLKCFHCSAFLLLLDGTASTSVWPAELKSVFAFVTFIFRRFLSTRWPTTFQSWSVHFPAHRPIVSQSVNPGSNQVSNREPTHITLLPSPLFAWNRFAIEVDRKWCVSQKKNKKISIKCLVVNESSDRQNWQTFVNSKFDDDLFDTLYAWPNNRANAIIFRQNKIDLLRNWLKRPNMSINMQSPTIRVSHSNKIGTLIWINLPSLPVTNRLLRYWMRRTNRETRSFSVL